MVEESNPYEFPRTVSIFKTDVRPRRQNHPLQPFTIDWSKWQDSNLRPSGPEPDALARLSYT